MTAASASRSFLPLLSAPRASFDEAIDAGEFGCQGAFDAPGAAFPLGHLADVANRKIQEASGAAVDAPLQLVPIDGGVDHIIREGDGEEVPSQKFTLKGRNYDSRGWLSIKIMPGHEEISAEVIGKKVRELRKSRGLSQPKFAKLVSTKLFSVSQSLVSLWEVGDRTIPAPALMRISEIAEERERQWWRDQAAIVAGMTHAHEDNEITPLGRSISQRRERTIPVINPKKVGDLGSVNPDHVEEQLRLPADWFPMGGEIRAVRLHDNPISPVISGEYLAILDISRRDPDRLIDCIVATRTPEGIAARWLRKDREVYFLQSLNDMSAPPRILRHEGEDSIVGQVLKWIGDAPAAPSKPRQHPPKPKRKAS